MESKTIEYKDTKIFYRVYGNGYNVVLLHGFNEDGDIWHHQVDALQKIFRLIVPDIPGSGASETGEWPSASGIVEYAESVKVILDNERIQKCTMIGHSMGGYVTLAFAEKYPSMLDAFGLFHSSAFADTEEKKESRKKAIEFMQKNGAYAFLTTAIPGLFSKGFAANHPKVIGELVEKGKNFTAEALIQYYEAMMARTDRTHVLKTFAGPILFVMGEHDTAVPMEAGLKQSHLPVQSHVHILKESGHMGMLEETEKSNDILLNFLNFNPKT